MNRNNRIQTQPIGARLRKISIPKTVYVVSAVVLLLRLANPATASLSYLVLAAYALSGRAQAIQALFLSWVITTINPGLAPNISIGAIGRYTVIVAVAMSIILHRKRGVGSHKTRYHVVATVMLGLFLIMHSLLISAVPDVSVLKVMSFIVVFTSLLSAWGSLDYKARIETEMFIFGGMIVIALVSLPLIISGVGYFRNGSGFQGTMNHPQNFGPFVALLAAWLASRFLSERKLPLWQIAIIILCPVMILASESRTAGGALALGIALPLLFTIVFSRYKIRTILPGIFTKRFMITTWTGIIGLLIFSVVIFTQLDQYFLKSGRSEGTSLAGALEKSRGELVYRMYDNIKDNPVGGIGFGIGSIPEEMLIVRDPMLNLPISASIEKGVLPVAIIEELGVFGGILVFSWFWMLIRRSARAGFDSLVIISTALITNLGESMFFSVGDMGLLLMILSAWASTPGKPDQKFIVPTWIK